MKKWKVVILTAHKQFLVCVCVIYWLPVAEKVKHIAFLATQKLFCTLIVSFPLASLCKKGSYPQKVSTNEYFNLNIQTDKVSSVSLSCKDKSSEKRKLIYINVPFDWMVLFANWNALS